MSVDGQGVHFLPEAPPAGRPSWTEEREVDLRSVRRRTPGAGQRAERPHREPLQRPARHRGLPGRRAVTGRERNFAYVQTRPPTGAPDCGERSRRAPRMRSTSHRSRPAIAARSATPPAPPAGRRTARRSPTWRPASSPSTSSRPVRRRSCRREPTSPKRTPQPGSRERSADGEAALHAAASSGRPAGAEVGHLAAVVEEEHEDASAARLEGGGEAGLDAGPASYGGRA